MFDRLHVYVTTRVLLVLGCMLVSAPAIAEGPTIAGTGAVTGTVTASKPFTAAQVYLRNAAKGVTFMVYTSGGKYQAINLYPGEYELTVGRRGFTSDPQKVTIQAGATAKADVVLKEASLIPKPASMAPRQSWPIRAAPPSPTRMLSFIPTITKSIRRGRAAPFSSGSACRATA